MKTKTLWIIALSSVLALNLFTYLVNSRYSGSPLVKDSEMALGSVDVTAGVAEVITGAESTPHNAGLSVGHAAEGVLKPIDIFFSLLRNHRFDEAYQSTSAQFKSSIQEQKFIEFVQKHPILSEHKSFIVKDQTFQNDKALVLIILNPEQEALPITIVLEQEGGVWQLWNVKLDLPYSPEVEKLFKDPESVRKPISEFLDKLKENQSFAAYKMTSTAFQNATDYEHFKSKISELPILQHFIKYSWGENYVDKGTGYADVVLEEHGGTYLHLKFILGIENDEWRIWTFALGALPGKKETISEDEGAGVDMRGLSLESLQVGTAVTDGGVIANAGTEFTSPPGPMYINLNVVAGVEGTRIEIRVERVDQHIVIPPLSTTLAKDGDTFLSFALSPPSSGWPPGEYRVRVKASTGAYTQTLFKIAN